MTKIAYIRTSTGKQMLGIEVQKEAIQPFLPDYWYIEQASGRNEERKKRREAIDMLERGDTLIIYQLDRLGRSTKQLVNLMSYFEDKGINLNIVKEGIDTSTTMGKLVYTILSAVAEMEAKLISERTKKALELSSKKGGRPRIDDTIRQTIKSLYYDEKLSVKEINNKIEISQSTIYRILKEDSPLV